MLVGEMLVISPNFPNNTVSTSTIWTLCVVIHKTSNEKMSELTQLQTTFSAKRTVDGKSDHT